MTSIWISQTMGESRYLRNQVPCFSSFIISFHFNHPLQASNRRLMIKPMTIYAQLKVHVHRLSFWAFIFLFLFGGGQIAKIFIEVNGPISSNHDFYFFQ